MVSVYDLRSNVSYDLQGQSIEDVVASLLDVVNTKYLNETVLVVK